MTILYQKQERENLNRRNKNFRNMLSLILMTSISILILLRDINGIEISRFIFISIAILICLINDKYGIYSFIAFIAPIAPGISYTYITAFALIILLFKIDKKVEYNKIGISLLALLLAFELASGLRGNFELIDYFRFAGILIFSFLMMIDGDRKYQSLTMLHYFIAGYCIAIASLLGQMLNVYTFTDILSLGVRFGDVKTLLDEDMEGILVSFNPNALGLLCIQVAIISIILFQHTKNKGYLIFWLLATCIGFMTQSIAFLVTYILSLLLYVLLSCTTLKSFIRSLLLSLTACLGIIIGIINLLPEYATNFLLRFEIADISNNRIDIANYYWQEMITSWDRLIFGVGLQNYPLKYKFLSAAHNATQEIMIAWGVIGLLIVISLLVIIFMNTHKCNPKVKAIQYLPLIATLVNMQSGQGFSHTAGLLSVMIMYCATLIPLGLETEGAKD